jgi:TolB-like protein
MSGDPDQDYFADGMVDEITTALSRFKSLFVIARNNPGAYEIGHYKVEDGFVVMCDENGRATGKKFQLIGEDAQRVAGRLLRDAWSKRETESDFNRPSNYAAGGWR